MWSIREATRSDLEALVDIAVAAMPMDPQWDYRFPLRRHYAQDTHDFTYLKYQEFMNSPQMWRIMVAEADVATTGSLNEKQEIVAFAIWEVSNLGGRTALSIPEQLNQYCPIAKSRRDGNEARMAAWATIMPQAKGRIFNSRFGKQHIHLQVLATHPARQRLGAGSQLCCEGIILAQEHNLAITVFASPMGKRLYSKLGFQPLGNVDVYVTGEEERVTIAALALEASETQYTPKMDFPALTPLVSVAA